MIQGLNRECAERGDILSELNQPEVTRELASQYPELRPIVGFFDEIALLFAHKGAGADAKAELVKLLGNCRSNGIRPIAATQMFNNVIDTKLPGAFTNVVIFKTALGEWEGRTILGENSDAQGYKPYHFTRAGEAVAADGEDGRKRLRVYPLGGKQQRKSIEQGLAARGGAVTQVPLKPVTQPARTGTATDESGTDLGLLRDIVAVAAPTSEQVADDPLLEFVIQTDPLVALLQKSGKKYAELTSSDLRKRLDAFGLKSHQKNLPEVNGKRPSRNGWWFSEIHNIIINGGQS